VRYGSESGFFKKLCWWGLGLFAFYCVVRDPNGAGNAAHHIAAGVTWLASGIDTFVNKI
jgi:hypothetical protein